MTNFFCFINRWYTLINHLNVIISLTAMAKADSSFPTYCNNLESLTISKIGLLHFVHRPSRPNQIKITLKFTVKYLLCMLNCLSSLIVYFFSCIKYLFDLFTIMICKHLFYFMQSTIFSLAQAHTRWRHGLSYTNHCLKDADKIWNASTTLLRH